MRRLIATVLATLLFASSALAQLAVPGAQPFAGLRSLVINGAFNVNQRGYTSGTTIAGNGYFLDRWKAYPTGGSVALVGGGMFTTASLSSTTNSMAQIVEGANVLDTTYTLSWASDNYTTVSCRAYQGTVDNAGAPSYPTSSPVTYTGLAAGTNVVVQCRTLNGVGTVTQIQLEAGAAATAFEKRFYAVELFLCQRYYFMTAASGTAGGLFFSGNVTSGAAYYANTMFSVPMRAVPTITASNLFASSFPSTSGTTTASTVGVQETRTASATATGTFVSSIKADADF